MVNKKGIIVLIISLLLFIGIVSINFLANRKPKVIESKAYEAPANNILSPDNPSEFEIAEKYALYNPDLIPNLSLKKVKGGSDAKAFLYRQPNWFAGSPLSKYELYLIKDFSPDVVKDLNNKRVAYLKKYFTSFYAPLSVFSSSRQRAHIDFSVVMSQSDALRNLNLGGDPLLYHTQVINAQVLFDAGYTLQVLVLDNLDGSVNPQRIKALRNQGYKHFLPLTDSGVSQTVDGLVRLKKAITRGQDGSRLTFIYGNEPALLNPLAGETIITADEYWNDYYRVKLAAAQKGITVEPAAMDSGGDLNEHYYQWVESKWKTKAAFLRKYPSKKNILKDHDSLRINQYEKNAQNHKRRFVTDLQGKFNAQNELYSNEFDGAIVKDMGIQEISILLVDPVFKNVGYKERLRIRKDELPNVIREMQSIRPQLSELSIFILPYVGYPVNDENGFNRERLIRDSGITTDWDGDKWDLFSEKDLMESLVRTIN